MGREALPRTLERVFDIMIALGDSYGLTMDDLVDLTGVTRRCVYRMLGALEAAGAVFARGWREGDRRKLRTFRLLSFKGRRLVRGGA